MEMYEVKSRGNQVFSSIHDAIQDILNSSTFKLWNISKMFNNVFEILGPEF